MSRASAYVQDESREIPTQYPLASEPIEMWTKSQIDVENTFPKVMLAFDVCSFYKNMTDSVYSSIFYIKEQLGRQLLEGTHVIYTSFCDAERLIPNLEQDTWVDMPPLSIEKVVMQVKDMGYGEPLAILDPLLGD